MNTFKGWRTIGFNVLAASPILVEILALPEWYDVVPDTYMSYYLLFIAAANVYLRSITDTPLGKASSVEEVDEDEGY